ncbi:hypothetical protein EYF80_048299 [Liparis tanakae]|uniref:Uncharacterized protein n=1 Tax=Liparis tanakae TaxID=230148 RepID=A0A4Z2FK56_9TELE|nr:hypothetical protein EYF80_048299 [Liparis tanakae]
MEAPPTLTADGVVPPQIEEARFALIAAATRHVSLTDTCAAQSVTQAASLRTRWVAASRESRGESPDTSHSSLRLYCADKHSGREPEEQKDSGVSIRGSSHINVRSGCRT